MNSTRRLPSEEEPPKSLPVNPEEAAKIWEWYGIYHGKNEKGKNKTFLPGRLGPHEGGFWEERMTETGDWIYQDYETGEGGPDWWPAWPTSEATWAELKEYWEWILSSGALRDEVERVEEEL